MRFTENITEVPSSLSKIVNLIKGKTIENAVDLGNEFQLVLSDDYTLRFTREEVNLWRSNTKNKGV